MGTLDWALVTYSECAAYAAKCMSATAMMAIPNTYILISVQSVRPMHAVAP